jgi:sugar-specific transcriptional regulator TrmB
MAKICYAVYMNDLSVAGLSANEATIYKKMLNKKEWLPSDLAKETGESRTNIYKILDNLNELKLVEKYKKNNKLHYRPVNPTMLLELARKKRMQDQDKERQLEATAQSLYDQYIRNNYQPGIRYFQGQEEISSIYKKMSLTKTNISFIHSSASVDFFSFEILHKLRMMAVKNKVPRSAITSDGPRAPKDYKEADPLVYLERTWLAQNEYTAPVEIGVYDSTVYIISFGTEAMGLTIESPQISEAFRQILNLLSIKQKQSKGYDKLPKVARGKAIVN